MHSWPCWLSLSQFFHRVDTNNMTIIESTQTKSVWDRLNDLDRRLQDLATGELSTIKSRYDDIVAGKQVVIPVSIDHAIQLISVAEHYLAAQGVTRPEPQGAAKVS